MIYQPPILQFDWSMMVILSVRVALLVVEQHRHVVLTEAVELKMKGWCPAPDI